MISSLDAFLEARAISVLWINRACQYCQLEEIASWGRRRRNLLRVLNEKENSRLVTEFFGGTYLTD